MEESESGNIIIFRNNSTVIIYLDDKKIHEITIFL